MQMTKFSMETADILKANKKVWETACIPTTQESLHVRITNEDSADHFLQYQRYCSLEFIPQGQTVNQAYYV
jgi:hypothetical protein